jgi:hypothetical protein
VARHLRPQSMAGDMIQPSCLASVARCERLGKIADAAERELAAMEKMTAPAPAHRKLLKSIEAPYLKMPELLARLSQAMVVPDRWWLCKRLLEDRTRFQSLWGLLVEAGRSARRSLDPNEPPLEPHVVRYQDRSHGFYRPKLPGSGALTRPSAGTAIG